MNFSTTEPSEYCVFLFLLFCHSFTFSSLSSLSLVHWTPCLHSFCSILLWFSKQLTQIWVSYSPLLPLTHSTLFSCSFFLSLSLYLSLHRSPHSIQFQFFPSNFRCILPFSSHSPKEILAEKSSNQFRRPLSLSLSALTFSVPFLPPPFRKNDDVDAVSRWECVCVVDPSGMRGRKERWENFSLRGGEESNITPSPSSLTSSLLSWSWWGKSFIDRVLAVILFTPLFRKDKFKCKWEKSTQVINDNYSVMNFRQFPLYNSGRI